MTPSPQTVMVLNLYKNDFGMCLKSPSWILLFSRVWLVLTQFRKKHYFSVSWKTGYWYFWTSEYRFKHQILWELHRCPRSHSCESRASSKSPDFFLVAFASHQLPQVDPSVSIHPCVFYVFQPINKCAFPQASVENTNACTFFCFT